MVVGIVSLVLSWIPFVGLAAILGLILSARGMKQSREQGLNGYGMAVAGLVCSIVALIPAIIELVIFFTAAATCVAYC